MKTLKTNLVQQHQEALDLGIRFEGLSQQLQARERADIQAVHDALSAGLKSGMGVYRRFRWLLVLLFSSLVTLATAVGADWPAFGQVATFVVTALGFWFVPNILERPTRWVAMREVRRRIHQDHPRLPIPTSEPDFEAGTWEAIAALEVRLATPCLP